MQIGRYGLWVARALAPERYGAAAALTEELGFGALWLGGSPRLPTLRPLLEASDELVIATGIVNVWQYEPDQLAAEFAELDTDFPGRLLLGIGIGHRETTSEYTGPLTTMRTFLDGLAAAAQPVPRERMVLAALGPKMLDLAGERTLGTHPYFTPPAHTAFARERLGAGALVAPEQAVVIDPGGGAQAARAIAAHYANRYLRLSNYTGNLRRFGYTDADIEPDGGSEPLLREIVPQGSAEDAAAAARGHLDAGADHVCVQTLLADGDGEVPARVWRELAAALIR